MRKAREEVEGKLAKTIIEAKRNKEMKKVCLKERLERIYNLDNENGPFDSMLYNRDAWRR